MRPERHAVVRDADAFLALARDRVLEPDALDEAAVAAIARVGDHDVVEGAVPGPAAGKSDDDHVDSLEDLQSGPICWVDRGRRKKMLII